MRYDLKSIQSDGPEKKLYDLINSNASAISEITDSQVKLGKLEGTAAGIDTANLPSLLVVRQGSTNTCPMSHRGKFLKMVIY